MQQNNRVTLGVQSGDLASSEAMRPSFMPLRRFLDERCRGAYCDWVDEFAIVLRISGSLWSFEGEGVQKIRLSRKGRYVTADYVVPESRWKGAGLRDLKAYTFSAVTNTLVEMCDKLKDAGAVVKSDELFMDLAKIKKLYLE